MCFLCLISFYSFASFTRPLCKAVERTFKKLLFDFFGNTYKPEHHIICAHYGQHTSSNDALYTLITNVTGNFLIWFRLVSSKHSKVPWYSCSSMLDKIPVRNEFAKMHPSIFNWFEFTIIFCNQFLFRLKKMMENESSKMWKDAAMRVQDIFIRYLNVMHNIQQVFYSSITHTFLYFKRTIL